MNNQTTISHYNMIYTSNGWICYPKATILGVLFQMGLWWNNLVGFNFSQPREQLYNDNRNYYRSLLAQQFTIYIHLLVQISR